MALASKWLYTALTLYTRARASPGIALACSVHEHEACCMHFYTCALLLLKGVTHAKGSKRCA
eukprot:10379773-Alexandrium_andersonii.AAC.1